MKTLAQLASEKVQENLVKLNTNQIRFPGSLMDPIEQEYTKKYSKRCLKEISKHAAKVLIEAVSRDIEVRGQARFGHKEFKRVMYLQLVWLLGNFQEGYLLKYGLDFLELTNQAGKTEQQLTSQTEFLKGQVDALKKDIAELRNHHRLSGVSSDEKVASLALTNFQQKMIIDQLKETVEVQDVELQELRQYVESFIEGAQEFKKLLDTAESSEQRSHAGAGISTDDEVTPRKKIRMFTDRTFEDSPASNVSRGHSGAGINVGDEVTPRKKIRMFNERMFEDTPASNFSRSYSGAGISAEDEVTPRKKIRMFTDRKFEDSPVSTSSQRTTHLFFDQSPQTDEAIDECSPPYFDAMSQVSSTDAE